MEGVGSGPQAFVGAAEVLHEVAGPVFRITINRPDKRNAIHGGVVACGKAAWAPAGAAFCGWAGACAAWGGIVAPGALPAFC